MGKVSITVDEARAILATEEIGTERYALANTIISTAAANEINVGLVGVKITLSGSIVACEPMWRFVMSNKLSDAELESLRAGDAVALASGHVAQVCS